MSQQFGKDVVMDGVRGRGESLFLAILAGLAAAAVGAGIWMAVRVGASMHSGFIALGVGALVGFAVRLGGNGRSVIFGIVGALLTLVGCVGGEVLSLVQEMSSAQRDFLTTLTTLDLSQVMNRIVTQSSGIDYLIYALGVYEGFKFSMRS